MTPAQAAKVLKLDHPGEGLVIPVDAVKAAFAAALKAAHPDTRASRATNRDVIAELREIQEARQVLLTDAIGRQRACKACGGAGTVRAGFGRAKCGSCQGSGETRGQ